METTTFVKPSGVELEVNSSSHDAAIALGWVPKSELEAAAKRDDSERAAMAARAVELGITVGNKKAQTLAKEIAAKEAEAE